MNRLSHTDIFIIGSINDVLAERLIAEIQDDRYQRNIPLRLFINSPGGSMPIALTLARLLLQNFNSISTYNMATVDSAAVCLYLAGKERSCFPTSRFYLHPPTIPHEGPLSRDALEELSLLLKSDTDSMTAFYHERTGIPNAKLETWFQKRIVLTCAASLAEGISTGVCSNIDDFSPRYVYSSSMPAFGQAGGQPFAPGPALPVPGGESPVPPP